MKRIALIIAIIFAASSLAQSQSKSKRTTQQNRDEQALAQLVRNYYDARLRRDAEVLKRILADDFTGIYSSSGNLANKDQNIENFTTEAGPKYESIKVDDINIRIYGKTAVIICRIAQKGTFEGKSISSAPSGIYQFRAMLVCVKRNGHWQIVAVQGTHIVSE